MDLIVSLFVCRAAMCALSFIACSAFAGSIGSATVKDVTLGGLGADALSYGNGINPQSQGPKGGSIVFGPAFAATGSGAWTRLAAFDVTADNGFTLGSSALGTSLTMSFDQLTGRNGTWTLTNNDRAHDLQMDLVFALHTGGGSGAWLFDDQLIGAGKTLSGLWALNLLNNGGSFSGYSNLTIFGRNALITPVKPGPLESHVPEPAGWAMLALGLGLMGALRRKRPV